LKIYIEYSNILAKIFITVFLCLRSSTDLLYLKPTLKDWLYQSPDCNSIRKLLERDISRTLDSIKKIGYSTVELAGTIGLEPDTLARMFKLKGLSVTSIHFMLADFEDSLPKVNRYTSLFGAKNVVLAWINPSEFNSIEKYRKLADKLNK